ncbi:MAG TPA: VWA domain-containing protein [Oceanipulchritudo sp.]|nr:VWA domain-containing protein [Oceanipulchritudo sp.]
MIFQFAEPQWLFLLLLLPVLLWLQGRAGRHASVRFPSTLLAGQIAAFVKQRPGRWRSSLRWLAVALFISALARPQTGEELTSTESSGTDIVIAVDLSTSMWAHDFEVSGIPRDRLTVVRSVMSRFIDSRRNDRLGLIAFAAEPYLVSPLTLNHDWLQRRLEDLSIGQIEDGTAIGSAIGAATNRLRDIPADSKSIILVTDGANNRGQLEPTVAAEAARSYGIKIYAIGVGEPGTVPFPARFGRNGQPVRDTNGRILLRQSRSDIDLETLEEVASLTNGRYFHATDSENLREIYAEIDRMEQREVELKVRRLYTEAFPLPLLAGLGLLLVDILLKQTRHRRLP